jgi:hypothetical protein
MTDKELLEAAIKQGERNADTALQLRLTCEAALVALRRGKLFLARQLLERMLDGLRNGKKKRML